MPLMRTRIAAMLWISVIFSLALTACSPAPESQRPTSPEQGAGKDDTGFNPSPMEEQTRRTTPIEPEGNQTDTDDTRADAAAEDSSYYIDPATYRLRPVGDADPRVVLLTIDDGPRSDEITGALLEILAEHDAPAIFFINGFRAEQHPALIHRMDEAGHMVGNHGWSHRNLADLDAGETYAEIVRVNDLLQEILGKKPVYFRPPFGRLTPVAADLLVELGMQRTNWSLGSKDWIYHRPEQADQVVRQTLDNLHPGANILLHELPVTIIALPDILAGIHERGYTPVLPDTLVEKGTEPPQ